MTLWIDPKLLEVENDIKIEVVYEEALRVHPWMKSYEIYNLSYDPFDDEEAMVVFGIRKRKVRKNHDYSKYKNTGKSYKQIGMEILKSDPGKWWSSGELTKKAFELNYFDKMMPDYLVSNGFSVLCRVHTVEHKKAPRRDGDSRFMYFFRISSESFFKD
jgi:hypothetical protein